MAQSLIEQLADLTVEEADQVLAGLALTDTELEALWASWVLYARPEQLAPDWAWRWWVIVTGRGWGKNRTASEWIVDRCEAFAKANAPHLVGLIGQNNDDVKALQIGGVSGIREVVRRRGHTWLGAPGTLEPAIGIRREDGTLHISNIEVHTAMEPEGPRGRNFQTLGMDEMAAWKHKTDSVGNTVFTNAELALRGKCPPGLIPQAVITTTPKPVPVLRDLLASKHGPTHISRGSLYDNVANLPPEFVEAVRNRYEGTRLAAQELHGEVIDSVEGALWTPDLIHRWRAKADEVPDLMRACVAVDPSGSDNGDECGIVGAGVGRPDRKGKQHLYVLEDESVRNRPEVWAPAAVALYHKMHADAIVAETNFGAAMVPDIIHLIDPAVPVKEVRASRGKRVRAEPVAMIYDQGLAHHVGVFPQLEEQQCYWTPMDPTSPDRMDALVWAATWLLPNLAGPPAGFAEDFADMRAA